jgi:hypothetical protein
VFFFLFLSIGNSLRDESLLSSTTKKFSIDSTISVTLKEECFLSNNKQHTKKNYMSSLRPEERCELEIMSPTCDTSDNNTEIQLITNSDSTNRALANNCHQNSNYTMMNCINLSLNPQQTTTCDTIIINNDISNTTNLILNVKPQQQNLSKESIKFKRLTNLFNYIIRHRNDNISNHTSPPPPSFLSGPCSMKITERKINWNRDSPSIKSGISNKKMEKPFTTNGDGIYQDDDNEIPNCSGKEGKETQLKMKRKSLVDRELRQDYFPNAIGETELDLYMRELRKRQFVHV